MKPESSSRYRFCAEDFVHKQSTSCNISCHKLHQQFQDINPLYTQEITCVCSDMKGHQELAGFKSAHHPEQKCRKHKLPSQTLILFAASLSITSHYCFSAALSIHPILSVSSQFLLPKVITSRKATVKLDPISWTKYQAHSSTLRSIASIDLSKYQSGMIQPVNTPNHRWRIIPKEVQSPEDSYQEK